jgi:hypothetical protein
MSLIIGLWIYNSKLILNIFIKKAWNEDLKDKAFARANNNFVKISKVIKTCCISTLRGQFCLNMIYTQLSIFIAHKMTVGTYNGKASSIIRIFLIFLKNFEKAL